MQMVSIYSPVPNYGVIKFNFWTNFPTHFTLSFSILHEFDLKKPSSLFKDLDKFIQPVPTISHPHTIRCRRVAFELDHIEQLIENKEQK